MSSELDCPNTAEPSGTERPTPNATPWRFGCPVGHTAWYRTGERYYCRTCDEPFERLRDRKAEGVVVPGGGR